MAIKIVPFAAQHEAVVSQFNDRLKAGHAGVRFSTNSTPDWLPRHQHSQLYQERFLAIDQQSDVRGAYIIKHQEFRVRGATSTICQFQCPLSEGIVNRKYNHVGLALLNNAMRRHAKIFVLGMGGIQNPFPQLLLARRWTIVPVPFFFRILRPRNFLRNVVSLRRSKLRRWACDILAHTGLGWAGAGALNLIHRPEKQDASINCCDVSEFGEWADRLWMEARDEYAFVGARDSLALNTLYSPREERFIRLRVQRAGEDLGWVVLLRTAMSNHNHFGNMTVGTIVDGFSRPEHARHVVACARRHLKSRGADLIVSNQAHRVWCDAFRAGGFFAGPTNFLFAASPQLAGEFEPLDAHLPSFHINRGDGDGPVNL